MPINTSNHHEEDGSNLLDTNEFTAGPDYIQARQTPYGKLIEGLENTTRQLLEEADSKYPDTPLDASNNVEGQYAIAYRKALDEARQGKYRGLMALTLNHVNVGPEEAENMVFDEIPTPAEAEDIFLAMGKKQFPELANANFDDVCALWKATQMADVPPEFYPPSNRSMNVVLPVLRQNLHTMMVYSGNVLNPFSGPDSVKLCYAMMVLEKRLSKSVNQMTHPDMTMLERMAADNVRNNLDN